MAKIIVRNEQFQIDFTQQPLSNFFYQQPGDSELSKVLLRIDNAWLAKFINQARLTLLIACESIKDLTVINLLQSQADKGVRIYLLLGDETQSKTAIDMLSGRCLIRTGIKQQGTLLLHDHASPQAQGFLLTSKDVLFDDQAHSRAIELESMQREDSYRSFCKLFWEQATHEYLEHNKQQKAVVNPDSNIVPNHSHHLYGTLQACLTDSLSSLKAASGSDFNSSNTPSKLLLSTDSKFVDSKANDGVALTESNIPNILFSDDGDWLLPDAPDFSVTNWCLKLSASQSKQMIEAFELAHDNAAWQFKQTATLGDMPSQQAVRFSDQPQSIRTVEQFSSERLNDIYTDTIDDFFAKSADELTRHATRWQRDRLAHCVDFSVKIHPPYCPQEAKKDALYQDWQHAEDDWQRKLSRLESLQNTINQQQKSIADSLKGFIKGFLLGQGQSVKQFEKELEALKAWSVTTATPAEREAYRKRLTDFQQGIHQRKAETSVKLDEAKQHQNWEAKKLTLKTELAQKTAVAEQKQATFKQKNDGREEALKQAELHFIASWQKASASLNEKQLNELAIPTDEEPQVNESLLPEDKRLALSNMTILQAKNWKKTIKEKVWKKHYQAFAQVLNNVDEASKKIERDVQDANKAFEQSSLQRKQAEQALKDHGVAFTYQSNQPSDALDKQLGLKEGNKEQVKFVWPAEELPSNQTELRQYKQQRYLIIDKKEQFEQVQKDAARLNAKIVCDKEAVDA
ncbi:hypothetical protein Q4551_15850 [Oceanobacter sp. 5_MG-2023]|uniref:hypothetical protein n=1 Tax=Oceanobacter sp. 5_MG-2023 TaxID=3062645 RepID=UPI0026E1AFB0|nr:hypothetical protein [Oceanobacter sp. 5_MG-2023]MDO6683765.1 hypothetical protein [Oceanobacter sp. 5_MG-2023]